MSEKVDPVWIQKEIEKDELRLINLPAGHYYISRKGEIYSLNMAFPRRIEAIPKVNGEQIIVLYTPTITAYDVADLVLSTYKPNTADNSLSPCYRDANPANCKLDNLFWGDHEAVRNWRQNALNIASRARKETASDSEKVIEPEKWQSVPVPTMVKRTAVISALIHMIIDTTQRMMSDHEYDDDTLFVLRMVVLRFKNVAHKEFVPIDNLRSVFETEVPDVRIAVMMKRFHERFDKIGC